MKDTDSLYNAYKLIDAAQHLNPTAGELGEGMARNLIQWANGAEAEIQRLIERIRKLES